MKNKPDFGEPWKFDGLDAIEDGAQQLICWDVEGTASDENMERIVACVNACRGIPTENLHDGVVGELVNILKDIVLNNFDPISDEMRKVLTEYLAKVGVTL